MFCRIIFPCPKMTDFCFVFCFSFYQKSLLAKNKYITPFLVDLHFFKKAAICHPKFTSQRWKQLVTKKDCNPHICISSIICMQNWELLSMMSKTLRWHQKWSSGKEKSTQHGNQLMKHELVMLSKKSPYIINGTSTHKPLLQIVLQAHEDCEGDFL